MYPTLIQTWPTINDWTSDLTAWGIIELPEDEKFAEWIYKLLTKRYHNINSLYETTEDFKDEVAIIIEDIFDKYKKYSELAKALYKLTNDDLVKVDEVITSSAMNPTSSAPDPKTWVGFTNQQTYTASSKAKIISFFEYLDKFPYYNTRAIVNEFISCFQMVYINEV